MNRLTFEGNFCDVAMCRETPGGSFCEDAYCSQRKVWERLKQYEDTGLEPEEIKELEADWCVASQLIQEYKDIGKVQRALDLLKAEQEERLVVLPKEDAEFLAELRHELLTQPTDGNRDPRFWGVIEEKIEWGYNEECGEGWGVYDGEMCCEVGELDDLQALIEELTDQDGYGYDPEDFEGLDDPEEVVDRANELDGSYRFSLNYYRKYHEVSEEHLFLTKKACREYIDRYGYNHNKPHTYVMTAERCPEYEQLLKILKETKWIGGTE